MLEAEGQTVTAGVIISIDPAETSADAAICPQH